MSELLSTPAPTAAAPAPTRDAAPPAPVTAPPDAEASPQPQALPSNPYPGADKDVWVDRFAHALAARTGLPREVSDQLAAYVTRPKEHLLRTRDGYTLDPGRLSALASGHLVVHLDVHGFAGAPAEHNERHRGCFHSPLRRHVDWDLVLPRLVTGQDLAGPAPFVTTAEPVGHERLAKLIGKMSLELDAADQHRGYDLREDIEAHGQAEPTLHVALLRQIAEPDGAGGTRVRRLVDLSAVKGSNRSRARLRLFGLTPEDVIFGVRPRTLMGVPPRAPEAPSATPRTWVPVLAALLRQAYDDPAHPGHPVAVRARKVATVRLDLVIGAPDPTDFHNSVFDPNRMDHRRPPLGYVLAEKAASDLRALLREYRNQGLLSEDQRAWLAGEGPDPDPVPGETPVDARDRRDRRLLEAVFPAPQDVRRWDIVREVLGEPARSATGIRHVNHRLRIVSATANAAYEQRWNPRVLDHLLGAKALRERRSFVEAGSWDQLLRQAEQGEQGALETFVTTRGMHWLAEANLIQADRGSVAAQSEDDPDEDDSAEARRIRRTMANVRGALLAHPARAVALFRELARAVNTGQPARTVDESGTPVPGTRLSRAWFDEAFPKTSGRPRRAGEPTAPEPAPVAPPPNPGQLLVQARNDYLEAVTTDLLEAAARVHELGWALAQAAARAGAPALPDTDQSAVEALGRALTAAGQDVRAAKAALTDLQHGAVQAEDFTSAARALLTEAAR